MAFCKWLTEKEQNENLIDDREAYRLPTDAEWSMAVGLVNETGPTPEALDSKIRDEFPWGKQWPRPNGAGNYAGTSGRRRSATLPVGSFKSNSIGLYDLGGNVWEWCLDTFKATTVQLVAIGECCAAAPGPRAIVWRCNPLTEM